MTQRVFAPERYSAIYENPQNGWREAVPRLAWLWMLLFGVFYMALRNLWRAALLTIGIVAFASFVAWPTLFLIVPAIWTVTALKARDMLRAYYMRKGWHEIDPYQQEGLIL